MKGSYCSLTALHVLAVFELNNLFSSLSPGYSSAASPPWRLVAINANDFRALAFFSRARQVQGESLSLLCV